MVFYSVVHSIMILLPLVLFMCHTINIKFCHHQETIISSVKIFPISNISYFTHRFKLNIIMELIVSLNGTIHFNLLQVVTKDQTLQMFSL